MKQLLLIVISLTTTLIPNFTAIAQESTDCNPENIAAHYAEQLAASTTFDELSALQFGLRQTIADCNPPTSTDEHIFVGSGTDDEVLAQTYDLAAGYYLIEYHATWDGDSPFSAFAATFESDSDDPFGWTGEVGRGDVFGRRIQRLNFGGTFTASVEVSGIVDWQFSIVLIDEEQTTAELSLSVDGANRDVLGPIYLDEGFYEMTYELTHNEFAISDITTIDIVWTKPNAHERIGVDLEIGQGDWQGENLYRVEGGIYYVNFEVTGVSAWSINLTPQ